MSSSSSTPKIRANGLSALGRGVFRLSLASSLFVGFTLASATQASAQVVSTDSCFFSTPTPPPGALTPNCSALDELTAGDKQITNAGILDFPTSEGGYFDITQNGTNDGNDGNDLYTVSLQFAPPLSGEQGPYEYFYQISILPEYAAQGWVFNRVGFEVNSVEPTVLAAKGILNITTEGGEALGILESLDGAPVGPRFFFVPGDYTTLGIVDIFELDQVPGSTNPPSLTSITNSFTQRKVSKVPGPLSIFGAGVAFAYSRNLRKRIKLVNSAA